MDRITHFVAHLPSNLEHDSWSVAKVINNSHDLPLGTMSIQGWKKAGDGKTAEISSTLSIWKNRVYFFCGPTEENIFNMSISINGQIFRWCKEHDRCHYSGQWDTPNIFCRTFFRNKYIASASSAWYYSIAGSTCLFKLLLILV